MPRASASPNPSVSGSQFEKPVNVYRFCTLTKTRGSASATPSHRTTAAGTPQPNAPCWIRRNEPLSIQRSDSGLALLAPCGPITARGVVVLGLGGDQGEGA